MNSDLDVNIFLPHDNLSGGIKAVSKIAKYSEYYGATINIIVPKFPIIMGCDVLSKIGIGAIGSLIRRENENDNTSKIDEWLDGSGNIVRISNLQPQLHNFIKKSIPDADIHIATSWRTAYIVNNIADTIGEKYYFMQGYEIFPIWRNKKYWNMIAQQYPTQDASVQMANFSPTKFRDRVYKGYVDKSYKLDLDIIVTSQWEKRILAQLGICSTQKVALGVESNFSQTDDIRDNNELVITGIYRNSPAKGDRELLASFKKINKIHNNVQLVLFGPKKFEGVPGFVDYYENPTDTLISSLLTNSDIFIFPSWVEGFGLPPLEAMKCGCVIISTDVGAIREYAPENVVNFVPRNNSKAIVKAIESYKQCDDLQKYKFEAKAAAEQYTWKKTASKFLNILS